MIVLPTGSLSPTPMLATPRVAAEPARDPRSEAFGRNRLVESLSQTELDADVIGWFEQGSVLGLIRSLADRDPKETATTLARTVQHELVRCLTPDNVHLCSIRLER